LHNFFKWIKQHLKVKSFWGTSENAVRIQVYSAIIAYCLVAIAGRELKSNRSTYELLQVFGISLLDKTPVKELLTNLDYNNVKERDYNQLIFNLIKVDTSETGKKWNPAETKLNIIHFISFIELRCFHVKMFFSGFVVNDQNINI